MNLRNISEDFNIGLDMGTGSSGWAVTDSQGQLLHFKKQPTWGSRLFESAQPASVARVQRGQRRRYTRRRWRLNLLQTFFFEEIAKVDPEFFIRLRQSRLLKEDREEGYRDYRWSLFNSSDFSERDYYKKFPTIYHLRAWLLETDEKADIRLIYLALHNIVKHRGNFLRQGQSLSAKNADPDKALKQFAESLQDWCDSREYGQTKLNIKGILDILKDKDSSPSSKKSSIEKCLELPNDNDMLDVKKCKTALASAMVGLTCEFKNIFGEMSIDSSSDTKFKFSADEKLEAFRDVCPDDSADLFEALYGVYAAYILQGLLSYAEGKTISFNMIEKYNQYHKDLRFLKDLVHEHAPSQYGKFFRGPKYEGTDMYDPSKAQGYTKYNLGTSKLGYDDFRKAVEKLFAETEALNDSRYTKMMEEFQNQKFLRRLKTSDNGSIYYQLHLEEMEAILNNQGKHYPFLKEQKDKIESLVTFRIPYYVGPLSTKNAALDHKNKMRFAWAERQPGKESAVITPWNWEEIIDKDKSAERFIKRMTGMCTYLQGEEVLPKCSLLYQEFCVLNELNGAYYTRDGDDRKRFDAADREGIMQDLFMKKASVKYKDVEDWLKREYGFSHVHVKGGQGETGFESKLDAYRFFCGKKIFNTDVLPHEDYDMVEEIILWSTLFEDRNVLKEKLEKEYGKEGKNCLSGDQIKAICKKRFTGWGRLSEKFLTGLKVKTEAGDKSIMDVLREGDPNSGNRRGRSLVLMEALRDKDLNFQQKVDEFNENYFRTHAKEIAVNELPGSPAIRRSINQAMRIVDEIVKIAGKPPANIFIEVTREDDEKNKGKRTKRRANALEEAIKKLKEEHKEYFDAQVLKDLKNTPSTELDSERLALYFAQNGKCLYSGRPIDINKLSSGDYEVDHIIPRAYIKDDSFENKALVYREENQRKTNELLLDQGIRTKMRSYWDALHSAKLIGDKKYRNLLRDHIKANDIKGFINRQLVETSQMIKLIQSMLAVRYPDTNIVPVKAGISHNLRDATGFRKCRAANDYHHAHDAYLACKVGLFIQKRHPKIYDSPITYERMVRKYVQEQADSFKRAHRMPGSAGFIVNSFMSSGFDKETGEIFKDDWNAEAEIDGIRRTLNYRQCFITRMPYEDTGAFWDATIYSPRDPKKGSTLSLPLKEGLDPSKYGSYSREQFAYFFVYEAKKPGKEGRLFRFAQVPVYLAKRIKVTPEALAEYAKTLAEAEKLEFVRIERAKILKRQLIEIDGDRLLVTGKKEARNASEFAFTTEEYGTLKKCVDREELDEQDQTCLTAIWNRILSIEGSWMQHAMKALKIAQNGNNFFQCDVRTQGEIVLNALAIITASKNMVDLTPIGCAKNAGTIQLTYSKLLSERDVDFYVIDQSVTGMFERRTRIGL